MGDLRRVAIVGGETHLGEITRLDGDALSVVATCVKQEVREAALPGADAPNYDSPERMLAEVKPEVVAIANENDRKFEAMMLALRAGCDVVVDKPACITMDEQARLEAYLSSHPERRLLNLLTLRGTSPWMGLRRALVDGAIGEPAFLHIRMAVQLKRERRPPWFLDIRRSGGVFLDLLIHGIDQVEWLTGRRIVGMTARTGNLAEPWDANLRDHASVYCELDNGATAVVEGQRMLPVTTSQDYRVLAAGSKGYADMIVEPPGLWITNDSGAGVPVEALPTSVSVVGDWLDDGELVPQEASLRANWLALMATLSAHEHQRIDVQEDAPGHLERGLDTEGRSHGDPRTATGRGVRPRGR